MSYRTVFQNPCPDQDFASALFLQQTGGEMPESLDSLCNELGPGFLHHLRTSSCDHDHLLRNTYAPYAS